MNTLFQLRIALESTEPEIYRQIQLSDRTTFFELHHIIQIAMGWSNYHLYEFKVNENTIGSTKYLDYGDDNILDDSDVTLQSMSFSQNNEFKYEYDFGDSWKHKIIVEKILTMDDMTMYPICIGSQLCCPPEDSGGIPGFYRNLEIIKNKKDPEYKDTISWLGKKYDPLAFDIKAVNKKLLSIDKYIQKWLKN